MVRSCVRFVLLTSMAVAAVLFTSRAAQAFYWVDGPGSGSTGTTQTTTSTGTGDPVTVTGDPGGGDPGTGDPGSSSSYVPEPASLIVGLVGLGSIGLVRRFRRK